MFRISLQLNHHLMAQSICSSHGCLVGFKFFAQRQDFFGLLRGLLLRMDSDDLLEANFIGQDPRNLHLLKHPQGPSGSIKRKFLAGKHHDELMGFICKIPTRKKPCLLNKDQQMTQIRFTSKADFNAKALWNPHLHHLPGCASKLLRNLPSKISQNHRNQQPDSMTLRTCLKHVDQV